MDDCSECSEEHAQEPPPEEHEWGVVVHTSVCVECGQVPVEFELPHGVWIACGCGDRVLG